MGGGIFRALGGFGIEPKLDPSQVNESKRIHPIGYEGDAGKASLEPMSRRERYLYANGGRAAVLEERGFVHREKHRNQPDCAVCTHWRTNGPIEETSDATEKPVVVQATASQWREDRPEDSSRPAPRREGQTAESRDDGVPTVRIPQYERGAESTEAAQTAEQTTVKRRRGERGPDRRPRKRRGRQ